MANQDITRAKDATPARTGDVFDIMRDEMNRLFDRFDRGWPGLPSMLGRPASGGASTLGIDLRDDGAAIVVEADLPGCDEKDIDVKVAGGVLTIRGEKKQEREEKKEDYYLAERSFGSFSRSVRLPESVDESRIEAHFEKGVLKITAPKKPEAVKAERRIEIKQR